MEQEVEDNRQINDAKEINKHRTSIVNYSKIVEHDMVPQITTHFLYNTKLIQHLVVHTITYFNIGHKSIANNTHDNRPSHKTIVVWTTATTTR